MLTRWRCVPLAGFPSLWVSPCRGAGALNKDTPNKAKVLPLYLPACRISRLNLAPCKDSLLYGLLGCLSGAAAPPRCLILWAAGCRCCSAVVLLWCWLWCFGACPAVSCTAGGLPCWCCWWSLGVGGWGCFPAGCGCCSAAGWRCVVGCWGWGCVAVLLLRCCWLCASRAAAAARRAVVGASVLAAVGLSVCRIDDGARLSLAVRLSGFVSLLAVGAAVALRLSGVWWRCVGWCWCWRCCLWVLRSAGSAVRAGGASVLLPCWLSCCVCAVSVLVLLCAGAAGCRLCFPFGKYSKGKQKVYLRK